MEFVALYLGIGILTSAILWVAGSKKDYEVSELAKVLSALVPIFIWPVFWYFIVRELVRNR